jgi:predicted ABC-type ATPase
MSSVPPSVVVLAGPNGAGKTTASRTVLANTLQVYTFVNADAIAQGLAGFDPESAAIEASRIMLERIHALAEMRADFAFETTLAARTLASFLRNLRASSYEVNLFYFWLNSADLAVSRVAARVRRGGHNIPEATIRQRYRRSLDNFFRLYRPIVTSWRVYDNSESGLPPCVAFGDDQGKETILLQETWQQMHSEVQR